VIAAECKTDGCRGKVFKMILLIIPCSQPIYSCRACVMGTEGSIERFPFNWDICCLCVCICLELGGKKRVCGSFSSSASCNEMNKH